MSEGLDAGALRRLRALRRYTAALEYGDLDAAASALAAAEADPALERLILELHAAELDAGDRSPGADDTMPASTAVPAQQPETVALDSSVRRPPAPASWPHSLRWSGYQSVQGSAQGNEWRDANALPAVADDADGEAGRASASVAPAPRRRASRVASAVQALAAALVLAVLLGVFFALDVARLGRGSSGVTSIGKTTLIRSTLTPVPGQTLVVGGTWAGAVEAMRPTDGALYWRFDTGTGAPVTNVLVQDGVIYANASGEHGDLFALRAGDGTLLWHFTLHQFEGGPTPFLLTDGVVLVEASDGVYALSTRDGHQLWHGNLVPLLGAGDGRVFVAGVESSTPVGNTSTQPASAGGTITAVRATDGRALWTRPIGSDPPGRISTDGGLAFVPLWKGSGSGEVVALDEATGRIVWQRPSRVGLGGSGVATLVDAGRVYVVGDHVCAFDERDGRQLWCGASLQDEGAAAAFAGSMYQASAAGNSKLAVLRASALDGATGEQRWNWSEKDQSDQPGGINPTGVSVGSYSLPFAGADGALYIAFSHGLYALRASDGQQLWYGQPREIFTALAAGS